MHLKCNYSCETPKIQYSLKCCYSRKYHKMQIYYLQVCVNTVFERFSTLVYSFFWTNHFISSFTSIYVVGKSAKTCGGSVWDWFQIESLSSRALYPLTGSLQRAGSQVLLAFLRLCGISTPPQIITSITSPVTNASGNMWCCVRADVMN